MLVFECACTCAFVFVSPGANACIVLTSFNRVCMCCVVLTWHHEMCMCCVVLAWHHEMFMCCVVRAWHHEIFAHVISCVQCLLTKSIYDQLCSMYKNGTKCVCVYVYTYVCMYTACMSLGLELQVANESIKYVRITSGALPSNCREDRAIRRA